MNASYTGISPHSAAKVYRIFLKSEWKGAAPRRSSLRIPTIVLHDARVAPLQSPILREDPLVVMDRKLLCNLLFRGCSPLLPSLARRLQFAIAFFADHLAESCQAIRRSDVADSAVQSNVVVMVHVLFNSLLGFLASRRATRTNAFVFERAMPTFQLPIALRMVGARSHVCQAVLTKQTP